MNGIVGRRVRGAFRRASKTALRAAVEDLGVPPVRLGYRWVRTRDVREAVPEEDVVVIHPEQRVSNPLPQNAPLEALPSDRGWWGFSFRDVPSRVSGETLLIGVRDGRVVPYVEPSTAEFHVCVLTRADEAIRIREMQFRAERHPAVLRTMEAASMERATWFLERVYTNHSHWLTAHLPKILALRSMGLLSQAVMPGQQTTETIQQSLRMLGLEGSGGPRLDPIRILRISNLTVLSTDRFRPELLQSVRRAFSDWITGTRSRRLYISRARASRRRLVNEERIWPLFRDAGFQRVFMEDLSFEDQVILMGEADAVAAPHGAGLTNMIFCPPGTKVIEIADLSFPNPNFYATAVALDHRYWIIPAETRGTGHPLERDMWADPGRVREVLHAL